MALKTAQAVMVKRWRAKILLVEDEAGLYPALVQNMLLYRTMRARQQVDRSINPDEYAEQGHLSGGAPINIIAGDFLQIKPVNDLSVADDFKALEEGARRKVHPEHYTARNAILNIQDVIHLKTSKRFQDEAMPSLMEAMRASRADKPLSEDELDKLRSRKIEKCRDELEDELFADGHVVGMYWDTVARSISERAHRDARKLDVPLYCLQAADRRANLKKQTENVQATRSLLTNPNIHRTGKLHGMLLLHAGTVPGSPEGVVWIQQR